VNNFEHLYRGHPAWEIGRPQPAVVRLEESGEIVGRVLDVGCGTGENALYLESRGHETWGVDFAPTAIQTAREKATARGRKSTFRVGSALDLGSLHQQFDTIVDSGLFHTLLDRHRPQYAASLAEAARPGGRLFLLCFNELESLDWGGPRRVTQAEIRSTFLEGWDVRWIREERFETRLEGVLGRAWLAAVDRSGDCRRR
jgi:SAM-dependent methyltransferase